MESDVSERVNRLLAINGHRSVDSFHRELGRIMWDWCGMARNARGLTLALERIPELREEFWRDVRVLGQGEELNQSLEKAGRVADYMEFAELMCRDALQRKSPAAGHFGRSTRPKTAKRCGMIPASAMPRRGSTAGRTTLP